MRRLAPLLVVLSAAIVPSWALAEPRPAPVDAGVPVARSDAALEARRVRMLAGLKPGVRAKLDAPIQEVLRRAQPVVPVPGKPPPASVDLMDVARAAVTSASIVQGAGDADIMAIAFFVMMEAAKSAREDLDAIMAEVKAMNAKKQAQLAAQGALRASREGTRSTKACSTFGCLDTLPATSEYTKADLDVVKQSLAGVAEDKREASLHESTDLVSQRLLAFMDRKAKASAVLSNLLKKIGETEGTITQNMK